MSWKAFFVTLVLLFIFQVNIFSVVACALFVSVAGGVNNPNRPNGSGP